MIDKLRAGQPTPMPAFPNTISAGTSLSSLSWVFTPTTNLVAPTVRLLASLREGLRLSADRCRSGSPDGGRVDRQASISASTRRSVAASWSTTANRPRARTAGADESIGLGYGAGEQTVDQGVGMDFHLEPDGSVKDGRYGHEVSVLR